MGASIENGDLRLFPLAHSMASSQAPGSRRSRTEPRRAFLASLSSPDLELITRYINIARGWTLVGIGAFLIALKETYELTEQYEWPLGVYWVMFVLASGIIGISARREQDMRQGGAA